MDKKRLEKFISAQVMTVMPKPCRKPLKPNPFTTVRDPKTGQWIIVKPPSRSAQRWLDA